MTESIIISIDISKTDNAVMLVGKRDTKTTKVINVFTNDEAKELWNKLTTPKKGVLER